MLKKKKLSEGGSSVREKMLARKKKLAEKSQGGNMVFPKNGTTRIRILSAGPNNEPAMEIIRFYIGGKSVLSPASLDEPCPFMEEYNKLKDSKDEDDKKLAKKLIPKRRYVLPALVYKDEKGKELDYDGQPRLVMVPASVYQDIIDLYLDEDEAGDFTDPNTGYDIKIERSGSGQFDTSYSVRQCKPTKLDKKLLKPVDLEKMVKQDIKSYEDLEEELKSFLNESPEDEEEEEERPKKKDKKKNKLHRHHGDI